MTATAEISALTPTITTTPTPAPNVLSSSWEPAAQLYAPIVNRVAQKFTVDADMIAALITIESGWDKMAISKAGACGLTQVMPSDVGGWAARRPSCDTLRGNPEYAIEYGIHLLVIMYEHEESDWIRALGSYLCGYPDPETGRWETVRKDGHCRNYAHRVLELASAMKTR